MGSAGKEPVYTSLPVAASITEKPLTPALYLETNTFGPIASYPIWFTLTGFGSGSGSGAIALEASFFEFKEGWHALDI